MEVRKFRILGPTSILIGFSILTYLTFLNSKEAPLGRLENVLLVLLSGIFQFWGSLLLSREGRVNPSVVWTSVRSLFFLTERVAALREKTETLVDTPDQKDSESFLEQLSVHLGYIEEGLVTSIENWSESHPTAIGKIGETG